jgi:ABC-type uncharacterized transport system auxiliary subunit
MRSLCRGTAWLAAPRLALVVVVATALLSACSLAPTTVAPAVFDLGPPPPAAAATAPLRLRLPEPAAPAWLEGNGIGYRLAFRDPFRREVYRDSRWAAPPAALVGQRLRLRLAQRPCALPSELRPPTLQLSLEEFSQTFVSASESQGVVQLRATWVEAGVERLFTSTRASASADARGAVQGLSAAVDQALDEIITWVAATSPAAACR